MSDDYAKRLDELLLETQHRVGKDRAMFGNDPRLRLETVPLGIPQLDDILGGGLRRGRFALLTGEPSVGKSLFTQWVIKAF